MYPIQCHAGFYVPVKAGKMEVVGFQAVVNDLTAEASIKLVDDREIKTSDKFGRFLPSDYDQQPAILHDKTGVGGSIIGQDTEPGIKIRKGLSAVTCDNLIPGQIIVWVR